MSSVLDHRSRPLLVLPCFCFHDVDLHWSNMPFLALLVLFLHPSHVSSSDPFGDGSFPPPPIRYRSWTDFGPLSLRSLAPPAVSNGTETLRAFVRRPTVHRDGLPLHERARRTLSWWKPRAGGKESSLARGKPRDQGASTHGWMPTSRTTRRCGSNELEVSWDAEEVADEDRKREMMRRWIY